MPLMNYMEAAFAPAEAIYKEKLLQQTWGHLAPRRGKTYRGYFIFAVGCFGCDDLNPTPIECEFGKLAESPWFYNSLIDFIGEMGTEAGGVYRWEGTFRNYEFIGTVRRLQLI